MSAHARVLLLTLQNSIRHVALNDPDPGERLAADRVLGHLYAAGLAMRAMKIDNNEGMGRKS